MKNFMFNSNAKKKISITSALFSLLILFFALNCSFCGNFCSADLSDDNDGINYKETTNENRQVTFNINNEEEDHNEEEDKEDLPPANETDNQDKINQQKNNEEEDHNEEDDLQANETDNQDKKKDENESTEAKKPKRKGICGFCEIC